MSQLIPIIKKNKLLNKQVALAKQDHYYDGLFLRPKHQD
jgi:hypothetical protein